MQILSWHSPVGWAIFFVGIGIAVYLLALAISVLADIQPPKK